ncbi:Uncharacterised protein [Legionella hackeliae]|uniref:outer membrane protein n=1 Tax=Legionella hackeliae TaxID=449 RepID=UPI000E1982D0|nr:outer membrane beta-barrel protein [Legionella hackeliae]STX49158.1 Uncharacterised protein [Legionella hackeliae]
MLKTQQLLTHRRTTRIPINIILFYIELGSGVSFSSRAGISADTSFWDASPQGYNADLGNAPLFTAGLGYRVNNWFSFDITATNRSLYSYKKFQASTATSTINFQGNKTRFFDLSSNAVMLNSTLYGRALADHLLMHVTSNSTLEPILGAGIGTSYNTVSDFHSVLANSNTVASIMQDNSRYAFAYQLMAGMEWQYKRLSVDVGYQYFDGGRFETNNYVFASSTPLIAPPWTGHLKTNEIFAAIKVAV